jgi:hypothetical protein
MSWYKPEPKRIKGAPFRNFRDLVAHLDAGGYVWAHHKAYHPKVISNWGLGLLMVHVRSGSLCRAVPNPKYRVPFSCPGFIEHKLAVDNIQFENRRLERAEDRLALERFHAANGARVGA